MANDPNSPNIQDIINQAAAGANMSPAAPQSLVQPPMADPSAPQPPTLLNKPAAPSLGTEEQLQAPAAAASPNNLSEASSAAPGAAPSSITLPAQTKDNSAIPSAEQPQQQPSMLRKIGTVAADIAGGPQLANPNATLGQKAQGIMGILGKIGNAGVMATGSPEQRTQAIQQQGQQNQLLQMQNEAAYRRGMLGNTAEANTIKAATEQGKFGTGAPGVTGTEQQKQQIAQNKANGVMAMKGYVQDEDNPGAWRPKTPTEILADPMMSQNMEVKSAAIAAQQASAAVNNAKLQPDSQTQRNFNAKLAEQERVALAQLEVAKSRNASFLQRTQLPITDNEGNTHGYFNPQTNTFTPISGNPAAAAAAGGAGGVMPPKPTSSMLTMGQMAQTIQQRVPELKQEISDLGDKVGAAPGHWNDFWVKKVGADDPAYAGVDQDLQLYATALGKAHFGASMPESFVKDMMHDFSLAQSPGDLQSRVDHAEGWVNGYASRIGGSAGKSTAKPMVTPSNNGQSHSLATAMALPMNKGKSTTEVTADLTKYGYKVVP